LNGIRIDRGAGTRIRRHRRTGALRAWIRFAPCPAVRWPRPIRCLPASRLHSTSSAQAGVGGDRAGDPGAVRRLHATDGPVPARHEDTEPDGDTHWHPGSPLQTNRAERRGVGYLTQVVRTIPALPADRLRRHHLQTKTALAAASDARLPASFPVATTSPGPRWHATPIASPLARGRRR
jgi:hypothetical protein